MSEHGSWIERQVGASIKLAYSDHAAVWHDGCSCVHDMLVIARRRGQRIVIGPDVEVVVTEVTRTSVKLGIVAPKNTTILRGELRDAVEAANREAAETLADPDTLPLPLPDNAKGPWVPRG